MKAGQAEIWYLKHPRLTFSIFLIMVILAADIITAALFIPEDYNTFRTPNPYYHHDLKANQNTENIWGDKIFQVFTNSLGFKDKKNRKIDLKTDRKRILLLGDSFTEGVGMTWEESFTGILSSEFPDVEFLNAAVVSYSPKLYFLKTRYLIETVGMEMDELIVFIDNSDPMNEITYRHFEPYNNNFLKKNWITARQWLFKHSYIFYSISQIILKSQRNPVTDSWNRVKGAAFVDEVAKHPDDFIAAINYWSTEPEIFEKWGKEGLHLAEENMNKLKELCQTNNIKLSIVVYPWPYLIKERSLENMQVKFWRKFCMENNLEFINLYPAFINQYEAKEVIGKFFIQGDVHWNRDGHKYVAEIISEFIQ
jgi:hypothetical protein